MNIELCAGYGLVKLTPAFTNAVASMLMSVMTDTATRLDIPIETPVTPAHVRGFSVDQQYREAGGALVLTNNIGMAFQHGYIESVRIPPVYFDLQTTDFPEEYYGTNHMSAEDAVAMAMARASILKIGHSLEDTFARGFWVPVSPSAWSH